MNFANSIVLLMGVSEPSQSSIIFQILSILGGLAGIGTLVGLPWTLRKLRAETRQVEVSTKSGASETALRHLQAALEEADKTIGRIKSDAETKIAALEQQVDRLIKSLEAERARSEEERKLHEQRVVQLLYELRARDAEIYSLRAGNNNIGKA